jgi:hypothetical protein
MKSRIVTMLALAAFVNASACATDDFGFRAVAGRVHVHDLNPTI